MKFVVKRYGIDDINVKPCNGAFRGKVVRTDLRTISDPSDFLYDELRENWYNIGTNHRKINGFIARDIGTEDVWFLELNDIKDLDDLRKEYGDIILSVSYDINTPEIVLCNGYIDQSEIEIL